MKILPESIVNELPAYDRTIINITLVIAVVTVLTVTLCLGIIYYLHT